VGRHKGQTAGCGHFDHSGFAIAGQAVKSIHRIAQRAAYLGVHPTACCGFNHGFDGAFAAVRHRNLDVDRIGENLAKAGFDGKGHLQGRQAFLVRVGRDDDLHTTSRTAGICGALRVAMPQHRAQLAE